MNSSPIRPWWLRKRIILPLVLLVSSAVAGLVAFVNSDTSAIVIYNETGNPLPPLLIRACDQTRTFSAIADTESVRMTLKPDGSESAIHLELATDPTWKWDGEIIRPHGGHRVIIRLFPEGQVEAFDQISWWRR